MSNNTKEATASKKESAIEIAERIRYEKLRNAPKESGVNYSDLNLNGCTMKEILLGF